MKKVLFVATVVRLHINMFHKPYLKWFHDQGWQVDVAANNDYEDPKDCVIPNCDHFYCLPFERSPFKAENIRAYRQLKKILENEHYDIIHCHTPMGGVVARLAAGASRKKGTKVIYTAHGFHFYQGAPLINWAVYYPVEKMLAHKTDLLITINQEDYERAQKFKAKRVELAHGIGIDLEKFKRSSPEAREKIRETLGLKKGDIFSICVARLTAEKNLLILFRMVANLNRPNFHLFVCGDGEQRAELEQEINRLNLENQVHLLGFRKDVCRLCSAADLFLLASMREGLPVAVMEAMACGLPVICSDIRGNRDLVVEGKGGYLCTPKDVDSYVRNVHKVLASPGDLQTMGEFNVKRMQHFSKEAVGCHMAELYRSMMPEKKAQK